MTAAASSPGAEVVPRVDGWRQPVAGPASDRGSYKEWMHFCVRLPGDGAGHLLVNLNVTERAEASGRAVRTPRLIALGYLDGWAGAVESFAGADAWGPPGGVDLRLGRNELRWRDGAFHLALETEELAADLRLRPLLPPTVPTTVSFDREHAMHWVVIPRLEASGSIQIGRRSLLLERADAYHDHNWGHFRWGGDLAWEWGFVNPQAASDPFSVVFVRVSDGRRHRTLSQGALLWRQGTLARTFQNREIRLAPEGVHDRGRPFTLPRVAALLVPGAGSGVPARLSLEARGPDARLAVVFDTVSSARVAMPSDVDDFRLVLLNETCGHARVDGEIGAEAFHFGAPAVVELVRG